jgi:hypothetical protein
LSSTRSLGGETFVRFNIGGGTPRQDTLTGAFDNVANDGRLADVGGLGTFKVNYGPGSPLDSSRNRGLEC